ncbi:MAG TPA: TetR/AcrR family transcriptional regulator [Pirellulales bacterium]|nr:TetR/AcrR family transcriptional regulator [Pirellulales bacterium]
MRITADEKRATRRRIVEAAVDLFRSQGFETTTTRDIARAAGIAVGTLFNYFETKEALVASLAAEALSRAHAAWKRERERTSLNQRPGLDEDLFSLVAAELRQLRPLRKFLSPFIETILSPLVAARKSAADELRVAHLERVTELVGRHGVADVTPVALQMYWALYTGALAFWAVDRSPRQEDTLALLDESLQMFSAWLQGQTDGSKTERS